MAEKSGGMSGLLIVGAVLAVTAITIKVGLTHTSSAVVSENDREQIAIERILANDIEKEAGGREMTSETTKQTSYGSVDHATGADFPQKVLADDNRVLVDFYAEWCGPCRMIAPVLDEIAQEDPLAHIVKVNVDHSPELAAQYGVSSIPALLVFEDGQVVEQQTGLADKAKLRRMLNP